MPRLVFEFPDTCRVYGEPIVVHTADAIDEVVPALRSAEAAVRTGRHVAGYVAYEAAPALERRVAVRGGNRMPLLWLGVFDSASNSGAWRGMVDAGRSPPSRSQRPGPAPSPATAPTQPHPDPEWELDTDPGTHLAAVERIRAAIAAGVTYQVNLTGRFRSQLGRTERPEAGDLTDPAAALYHRLRRAQGRGYHAFLDLDHFAIASASPELFFRTRGRDIETRPMKGTRPRGRWPAEDEALRAELAGSAKDRAENLMIVDLVRNDLGRVAATGTVAVPRLLDVERYRTVWQMTSTVTARLRDDVGLVDLFRALFPCGSVTGAPKISTMEVIARLETSPREVYCGAIGFVEPGGDATFSVPIRTAWIDRETGSAVYGAGGGVVWDSTPESEYGELQAKAAVLRERWPEFRLLETLRLEDGRFLRPDRHLHRLRESAVYFGFPFSDDDARAHLARLAADHPTGVHRARLTLDDAGRIHATATRFESAVGAGPPHRVALTCEPVHSGDRFLYHKTTHREPYDRRVAAAPRDVFDVLLHNERGEITEFTRGNVVVELDGGLVTPPLRAGLLPGCLRAELLEDGVVEEATVTLADLRRAGRSWFINSLRGWVAVEVGARQAPPSGLPLRDVRPTP